MGFVRKWKNKKILYKTNRASERNFVLISGGFNGTSTIGGYWTGGYKENGEKDSDFPKTFTHTSPMVIPEEIHIPILRYLLDKVGSEERIIIAEILKNKLK